MVTLSGEPKSANTPASEYVTATSPPLAVNVLNLLSFGVGAPSTIVPPADPLFQPPSTRYQAVAVAANRVPSGAATRKRTTIS